MTNLRKSLIAAFAAMILSGIVWVASAAISGAHTAWADENYVRKVAFAQVISEIQEDARKDKIRDIDAQLAIKDTEILFARTPEEKEKLRAIKAIYERQREALQNES